ncbi:MAG: hypothetical protein JSS35_09520, partial [Proteobacteria bacterium]|nr:hypothetical protein [Pseudomonadota bacterium]
MILHVAPTAPVAVRLLADIALAAHISGGTTGLAAGTVAMVARKGGRAHRLSGEVFFFSMLAMSGVGAIVAPMIGDVGSAFAGAITFYLVITGWRAGRASRIAGGSFEIVGVVLLGLAVAALAALGALALGRPHRTLGGEPWMVFFIVAAIAGLIGALDL